jgi:hypothetical protein
MIATGANLASYWASILLPAAQGTIFANKVWRGSLAPQTAALPYLLYFLLTGADDRCLDGGAWTGAEATYFIKGVTRADQYNSAFHTDFQSIQQALEAEMLGAGRVLNGFRYTLLDSGDWREYEDPLEGGVVLVHTGRAWRVAVEPA